MISVTFPYSEVVVAAVNGTFHMLTMWNVEENDDVN